MAPGSHLPPTEEPRFRLRPHVRVFANRSGLTLQADRLWSFESPLPGFPQAVQALRGPGGSRRSELATILGKPQADELILCLYERNLLQQVLPSARIELETADYFQTALKVPASSNALSDKSVALVGCGGVGCEVARHLVSAGVGRLILIDPDRVEASNLNRQHLFGVADLGDPKVDAACRSLRRLEPRAVLDPRRAWIGGVDDLRRLDLPSIDALVCCADTPKGEIDKMVSRYAHEIEAIFALASVGVLEGSWGPIVRPGSGVTYHDWVERLEVKCPLVGDSPTDYSFGPTNALISAHLSRDLLHVLVGDAPRSLNHQLVLDFATLQIETSSLSATGSSADSTRAAIGG